MNRDERDDESMGPAQTSVEPRVILVDGFNVLHAVLLGSDRQDGWWKRELRERLLERVTSWRGEADEVWVAFDGSRPAESVWAEPVAISGRTSGRTSCGTSGRTSGGTSGKPPGQGRAGESRRGPTVYCLFVESADDWIVRRARRTERPEQTVVVSADRKVAGRARSAGVEVMSPWDFVSQCATDPGEGPG